MGIKLNVKFDVKFVVTCESGRFYYINQSGIGIKFNVQFDVEFVVKFELILL